jgi:hypothetical protein
MRLSEILREDYNADLENDLTNLLLNYKGSGAQEIKMQSLVQQLQGMGYSVNSNSIMTLLSRNPVVLNATPSVVRFTQPENSLSGKGSPGSDSATQVSALAQKATKIS